MKKFSIVLMIAVLWIAGCVSPKAYLNESVRIQKPATIVVQDLVIDQPTEAEFGPGFGQEPMPEKIRKAVKEEAVRFLKEKLDASWQVVDSATMSNAKLPAHYYNLAIRVVCWQELPLQTGVGLQISFFDNNGKELAEVRAVFSPSTGRWKAQDAHLYSEFFYSRENAAKTMLKKRLNKLIDLLAG